MRARSTTSNTNYGCRSSDTGSVAAESCTVHTSMYIQYNMLYVHTSVSINVRPSPRGTNQTIQVHRVVVRSGVCENRV
eukprot:399828-Prymnesium_polylepis.1